MGYAKAFPTTFAVSSTSNSVLTQAMDVARGGKFTSIPSSYPSTAWYTYNDSTCNYECQAVEYFYWGVTAWVGALVGRGDNIKNEWKFETRAKLEAGDLKMTAIIKVFNCCLFPVDWPQILETKKMTKFECLVLSSVECKADQRRPATINNVITQHGGAAHWSPPRLLIPNQYKLISLINLGYSKTASS